MLNFTIQVHEQMVPIILAAGALTMVVGLALLFIKTGNRRAVTDSEGISADPLVQRLNSVFRLLLKVTAGFGVLQAILGVALLLQGCHPKDNLHFVYGLIVLGAVPVAYVYSDQKQVRRDVIIMTIAAVAIIGAAIRGWMTGPGGYCG